MSNIETTPSPPASPPPQQRSGCLTAITAVIGVILLLPGLCALLFGSGSLVYDGRIDSGIIPFVLIGLLVGAVGIVLLRFAIRGRRG